MPNLLFHPAVECRSQWPRGLISVQTFGIRDKSVIPEGIRILDHPDPVTMLTTLSQHKENLQTD